MPSMSASLAEQYRGQERWRRWSEALPLLPIKPGHRLLALGCGVGSFADRLRRMGTEVVGVDANQASERSRVSARAIESARNACARFICARLPAAAVESPGIG